MYRSSAASSSRRLASSSSARVLTQVQPVQRVAQRRSAAPRWQRRGSSSRPQCRRRRAPCSSRGTAAPGTARAATPQRPKVWPKSSLCFSDPHSEATSWMPSRPNGAVKREARPVVDARPANLPCRRLLTPMNEVLDVGEEVAHARCGSPACSTLAIGARPPACARYSSNVVVEAVDAAVQAARTGRAGRAPRRCSRSRASAAAHASNRAGSLRLTSSRPCLRPPC